MEQNVVTLLEISGGKSVNKRRLFFSAFLPRQSDKKGIIKSLGQVLGSRVIDVDLYQFSSPGIGINAMYYYIYLPLT